MSDFRKHLTYTWVTLRDTQGVEYPARGWCYYDQLCVHPESVFWMVDYLPSGKSVMLCPDAKSAFRVMEELAHAIYDGEVQLDAPPGSTMSRATRKYLRIMEDAYQSHSLLSNNARLRSLVRGAYATGMLETEAMLTT